MILIKKKHYIVKRLEKSIKKYSKGKIPKKEREELAQNAVSKMNFDNHFQMHKSIEGYAQMIVEKRLQSNAAETKKAIQDALTGNTIGPFDTVEDFLNELYAED